MPETVTDHPLSFVSLKTFAFARRHLRRPAGYLR